MSRLDIEVGLKTKKLKDGLSSAKSSISGFGRTLQTAFGFSLANIFSRIADLGKEAITSAFKISARFEMLNLQFESLIGNTKMAKKLMADLREFSVKTPFTPEDVFKAGKILLTQFPAKEVGGEVKMLGEIAAVTGKDLNELALIYAKVAERGKVNARVLNQFANAGIPVSRFLAKVKGDTAIRDLSEQGKISFNDLRDAMTMMADEWQGLDKASQTMTGRWSTFVGVVKNGLASIGDAFSDQALDGLNQLIRLLEKVPTLAKGLKDVGEEARLAWDFTGGLAVALTKGFGSMRFDFKEGKFRGGPEALTEWAEGIGNRLQNKLLYDSYSDVAGRRGKLGELTGSGEFESPIDRALAMKSAGAKAFAGDAAAGLFRGFSRNITELPQMQLEEAKRTNEILSRMENKGSVTDLYFKTAPGYNAIKEGAGR